MWTMALPLVPLNNKIHKNCCSTNCFKSTECCFSVWKIQCFCKTYNACNVKANGKDPWTQIWPLITINDLDSSVTLTHDLIFGYEVSIKYTNAGTSTMWLDKLLWCSSLMYLNCSCMIITLNFLFNIIYVLTMHEILYIYLFTGVFKWSDSILSGWELWLWQCCADSEIHCGGSGFP